MKMLIAMSLLLSVAAQAELTDTRVQCKRNKKESCETRTVNAFKKLGCSPVVDSVKCNDAATDPALDPYYKDKVKGLDFCSVQSVCQEPSYGNFGQVSCSREKTESVNLKNADSGITLTTSVGLFQRMVTTLCK